MIGAVMGDMIGSPYEWRNTDRTDFPIRTEAERFTDDTVMTLAVTNAFLAFGSVDSILGNPASFQRTLVESMRRMYLRFPDAGYGAMFTRFLLSPSSRPYHSYGNGSAMRISPAGWAARSLDEVCSLSHLCTAITHDHPEGIKGAKTVAGALFLARKGEGKDAIRAFVERSYPILSHPEELLRTTRGKMGDCACQTTVPLALASFLLSQDEIEAIRLAVSLGGDSDTIACMAGCVAEAYWHRNAFSDTERFYLERLPRDFQESILDFHAAFGTEKSFSK